MIKRCQRCGCFFENEKSEQCGLCNATEAAVRSTQSTPQKDMSMKQEKIEMFDDLEIEEVLTYLSEHRKPYSPDYTDNEWDNRLHKIITELQSDLLTQTKLYGAAQHEMGQLLDREGDALEKVSESKTLLKELLDDTDMLRGGHIIIGDTRERIESLISKLEGGE